MRRYLLLALGGGITVLLAEGCGLYSLDYLADGETGGASSATSSAHGSSGSGGAGIHLDVKVPLHNSLYYGSHDVAARTLSFTQDGTSVLCSHDGGSTFGACDSPTTLVWTLADYTNTTTLVIKASKTGFADATYDYDLGKEAPGLTFYPCDTVVSAGGDTLAILTPNLVAGHVVCLAGGITIDNSASKKTVAYIPDDGSNIKILGVESNPPTLSAVAPTVAVVTTNNTSLSGIVFANLTLSSAGTAGGELDLQLINSLTVSNVVLHDAAVDVPCISLTSGGTVLLHHTTFQVDASSAAGWAVELLEGGNLTIKDSQIVVEDEAFVIQQSAGAILLDNVAVASSASSPMSPVAKLDGGSLQVKQGSWTTGGAPLFDLSKAATATMDTVALESSGGLGSVSGANLSLASTTLKTGGAGLTLSSASLTLDQTTFERENLLSGDAPGPALLLGGTNTLASTQNGNLFCNQSTTSGNAFTAAIGTQAGGTFTGTFALVKQVNQGMVVDCP